MKKFYKYFPLAALAMLIACPLFAWDGASSMSKLKSQISVAVNGKVAEQENSLYSFVKQQFVNYYGRADFAVPNRETGWYRVDDFLKWVQDNEEELQNARVTISNNKILLTDLYKENNLDIEENYASFWAYLGARYILKIYGIDTDFEQIKFSFASTNNTFGSTTEIVMATNTGKYFPSFINIGIHETTHKLSTFKYGKGDNLSELATFYSIYNYGLPVKNEGAEFKDGVRDLRRTIELRPDADTLKEYNYYLGGLVLNEQITPEDIFSLVDVGDIYRAPINLFIVNYIAMRNGEFFTEIRTIFSQTFLDSYYFTEQEIDLVNDNPNKIIYLGEKYLIKGRYKNVFAQLDTSTAQGNLYFFYAGKNPISAHDYISNMYGERYYRKIIKFYNKLYRNLPKQFVDKISKDLPVQTRDMFSEKRLNLTEILAEDKQEINQAILRTLDEMNIPKSKIPEGYI